MSKTELPHNFENCRKCPVALSKARTLSEPYVVEGLTHTNTSVTINCRVAEFNVFMSAEVKRQYTAGRERSEMVVNVAEETVDCPAKPVITTAPFPGVGRPKKNKL